MSHERSRPMADWLSRVLTRPQEELARWERALRFPYDLGRFGARQLKQDRASQMAGALAFRTLFALLPVLVVATVLARAFRGFDSLLEWFAGVFQELRWDQLQLTQSNGGGTGNVNTGETLSHWALGLIDGVREINFAAIGWVGVAVVIYSAIGLMITIEKCFNSIYRAPEGRSWLRRLTLYWTVLTLGPAAIYAATFLGRYSDTLLSEQSGWWSVLRAAPLIWSLTASWIVTFALYKLIPNTHVTVRPALVGALVAAVLLEIGKRILGAYFVNAVSFSQLYGSLGLIPVFMFWVYLMWLVILFGLEVSATLQMLRGRRLEEMESTKELTGLVDPGSLLTVMQVVARRFESSEPSTARDIADETSISEATVARMFQRLAEAGILHRLDREDGGVTLARSPDNITADELLEVGFQMVDEGVAGPRPAVMQRLRDAQRGLAAQVTLSAMAAGEE